MPETATTANCQNCGTELLGRHCYKCGQPVNGLVRHFGSIVGDFFDSVFDLDARTPRTLWPLFAKPGFLTREYFAGHRVRYVSPVRLFFFLSIVTFFVAQLSFHVDGDNDPGNATAQATQQDPDDGVNVSFNGRQWDPVENPVDIAWMPAFVDDWVNRQIGEGIENAAELEADPERFKDAVLGALPSTLFVLLPIFALMLKITYFFKRRLYMEHLIVALHSHAFLCLAVLLLILVGQVEDAVPVPLLAKACNLLQLLLFLWMPLYLLLMQKRVYGQGWIMTVLKYMVLGVCYFILLGFGVVATILASLVWG